MASIYDKASLVLIPSGTKTSKVYSQKPVSGDGDFTFSRSTAATRVNASGNIEKETQNLLTYSNTMTNADWTWYSTSVTGGQTDRDGGSDAYLVTRSSGGALIGSQSITMSGVYTFSVYVKINASNGIGLALGGTSQIAHFNISDENQTAAGFTTGLIDATQEYVGNNFYRLSITGNTTATQARFYVSNAAGTASDSGGGSQIIQDAQLEQGLVARDYIETTTTAIYGGITDNVPRLDYSGGATCPSLLLEPQRTNSATHSEYFGAWSAFRATITDNSATSPEGVSNAAVLTEDTTTNSHPLNKTFSVSNGAEYTLSIFAKQGSRRYLSLLAVNGGSTIYYDLQEKTAGSGGSVEDYGNGWLRLIYTYTTNSTSAELYIQPSINGSSVVYTGDGSNAVFLYGAQLEEGSYATSYIPTYGSGAVTRNGESNAVTGVSSLIGQTQGTLFLEAEAQSGFRTFSICDGSTSNRITIAHNVPASFVTIPVYGGVVGTQLSTSYTSGNIKIAVTYSGGNYSMFVNGTKINSASIGTFSSTLNKIEFAQGNGGNPFAGDAKQALVFPTALTDQEAIDLTTL